jgi:hypothetical protein
LAAALATALSAVTFPALASSHREAPAITQTPKVDATDFYIFNSYESGRSGYVTMIANYIPLQDAYGGPNYFTMDSDALYEIKIDNDGDAVEDLTFTFRFRNEVKNIALAIGPEGAQKTVAIPLIQAGGVGAGNNGALNVVERYAVALKRGRGPSATLLANAAGGSTTFTKPVDNIGNKTIADYDAYARQYVYDVVIPGCAQQGRVFVGQRKDPFVVNLGETFDLVNIANPIGDPRAERDDLADKNVTSLIVEAPAACLTSTRSPVIGAWTTASLPRNPSRRAENDDRSERRFFPGTSDREGTVVPSSLFRQVSRLSAPLVNEVVIGLPDKDAFNASQPKDDARFLDYVTHPTLPALLELLFGTAGVRAPTQFPRADLVAAFLTGLEGLNKTNTPAEMLRLNTSIAAKPAAQQSNLGALGSDLAGFPNGRRPGDDVVDIALRVVMGALLPAEVAPSGALPFTDGAYVDATFFDATFPYLRTPIPGSPSDANEGSR